MAEDLFWRGDVAGVERAKFGIFGAGFVEPHVVDDLLQIQRIGGPQRDAPLPICLLYTSDAADE